MSKGKMNADQGPALKPFDGKDDFTDWQRMMKNVLIQQDLDDALNGEKPANMTEAAWIKVLKKAKSSIEIHLTRSVRSHITEKMTAQEAWEKLENVYMGKTVSNKLFLKDELFGLRLEEGGDIEDHVCRFQNCIANLQKVEETYKDDDMAIILLRSLPSSFKHFRTTLMFGKESLKLEDVIQALQSYAKLDDITESSQGLYVKGKERGREKTREEKTSNRGRSKSKKKKEKKEGCFECGSADHWKRNCKIWKEKKAKMEGSSGSASAVTEHESDGELLSVTSGSKAFANWILDTGCTFHMCAVREWFDTYKEVSSGEVLMGDDSSCPVRGIGTVRIRMFDGMIRALGNVRYVPRLRKNLISLGTLDEAGYGYKSKKGRLRVTKGSLVVMRGDLQPNKLYKLIGTTIVGRAAVSVNQSTEDKTELWHHRLGHISQKGLQELHKQGLLEGVSSCKLDFCEYCVLGKQRKVSFASSSADNRSKEQLSYIHSDVWGPAPTKSNGGARYFVTFMDDFSRKVWVYFMKQKSEVFAKFKEWKTETENQTGRKIKYLRSDNGGEYTSNEFTNYCKQEGITRHFTVKKNPQQNGAAERMNRTLMERERSMRFHAGLPDSFWAEAVNHASYLINRSPSTVLDFKSAEEVWSEKPVDYSKLRVFGCSAFAHIPSDERSKLKPKSIHCIFLGFEKGVKGFKLWDFNNKKKVVSRDVVFDETTMPLNKVESSREKKDDAETEATKIPLISSDEEEAQVEQIEQEAESEDFEEEEEHQHCSPVRNQVEQETGQIEGTLIGQTSQRVRTPTNNPPAFQRCIALDKPKRNKKKLDKFGFDQDEVNYALNISQGDPTTYREAIASDERDSWISAMTEEMESLYKNSVWELVPKPKDRKLVGCKWVFRKKEGLHEQDAVRFKARLVAKGYSQKEGVDYDEIFSPVVKHTSIRLLLAMAAQHDMEIEQMDVKTAFLHGDLEEMIFMAQPEGFVEYGKENLVCQLKKSLYGLKQSPRQWYKRFDSFMLKINFRRCLYDCCVYYHVFQDGMIILLLLYVDDMLIACQDKSRVQDLKKMLSEEFDMKDLGAAQKILGMEIQRDRTAGRIWISQAKYIQKVLEKFNMQEAKVVSTPLATHFKLSGQQCPKSEEEQQVMEKVPYANVVGCLMYAMVCTRPDIAQAISVVSRYMANPGKQHWDAVKWILRYLKGSWRQRIMFEKQKENAGVLGYVDADYAGDLDKRRSTSGYVFTCAGGPISWRALLQPITALSTTEAEYIALAEAGKEAIWLSGLVSQMGITQDCVKLKCDSQSAIHLAKNQVFSGRSKHIEARYHRIRDWVESKEIWIEKVHTDDNAADFLTKTVPAKKFKHCLNLINLVD